MGTSACEDVPFPLRDSLRPAYICCCVIGWRGWCITRCNLFPKVCPFPAQDEKRTNSPADSLIVCIHSAIVDCTQFQCSPDHGHSSPVYATYPSPITGDLHLEDSRADSGISSFHSRPQSRCNSSTSSPVIAFTNNQPLRAKEASVCSDDFDRLIEDSHMYRINIR
jgi:hypothetical protein